MLRHVNRGGSQIWYGNGIKLLKNVQSKYGFWHNCSKICIQILDRAQLFKTHPFKYGWGDAALQDILSFSLVWVIMRIQTDALEWKGGDTILTDMPKQKMLWGQLLSSEQEKPSHIYRYGVARKRDQRLLFRKSMATQCAIHRPCSMWEWFTIYCYYLSCRKLVLPFRTKVC